MSAPLPDGRCSSGRPLNLAAPSCRRASSHTSHPSQGSATAGGHGALKPFYPSVVSRVRESPLARTSFSTGQPALSAGAGDGSAPLPRPVPERHPSNLQQVSAHQSPKSLVGRTGSNPSRAGSRQVGTLPPRRCARPQTDEHGCCPQWTQALGSGPGTAGSGGSSTNTPRAAMRSQGSQRKMAWSEDVDEASQPI